MHNCILSTVLLALFPLSALTQGSLPGHVLLEKRQASSDWAKATRLASSTVVPVRVGMAGNNVERGHEYLMDVYVQLPPESNRLL